MRVQVGDGEPDPLEEEFVPEEEEEDSDDDDDIGELMKRANNALNRKGFIVVGVYHVIIVANEHGELK